jgi:hypothetical protein
LPPTDRRQFPETLSREVNPTRCSDGTQVMPLDETVRLPLDPAGLAVRDGGDRRRLPASAFAEFRIFSHVPPQPGVTEWKNGRAAG